MINPLRWNCGGYEIDGCVVRCAIETKWEVGTLQLLNYIKYFIYCGVSYYFQSDECVFNFMNYREIYFKRK